MLYQVKLFKQDSRYKTGYRLLSKLTVDRQTAEHLQQSVTGAYHVEIEPKTKVVKNLMTGKSVEIDADTPWCCNPSSETYWSM